MKVTREARHLADSIDERAAAFEATARSADGGMPCPEVLGDAPLTAFGRAQWRDAGVASSLREVANALREAELPMLRARTWLVARQVECDCAAEESMARLAAAESGAAREAAVARSAFVLGRAKGIKIAAELCQPQPEVVR
jgi:hypothetical protein